MPIPFFSVVFQIGDYFHFVSTVDKEEPDLAKLLHERFLLYFGSISSSVKQKLAEAEKKSESGKCDVKVSHEDHAEAEDLIKREECEQVKQETENRRECDQGSCSNIGNQRCAGCRRALYCGQVQQLQFP